MYAIADRDDALASRFLMQGADSDDVDKSGWCALHFAAQNCSKTAVGKLLKAGAKLEQRDQYGNTPLWCATMSYYGHEEVISTLLAAGADPDAENKGGISPRSLANTIANHDTVKFFENL